MANPKMFGRGKARPSDPTKKSPLPNMMPINPILRALCRIIF
jgi:hypothetical protein